MTPEPLPDRRWSRRQLLKISGLTCLAAVAAALSDEVLIGATAREIVASRGAAEGPSVPAADLELLSTRSGATRAAAGGASPGRGRINYRSRPDLTAPAINVRRTSGDLAPGLIFFTPNNGKAPDGPMIVNSRGDPIWIHPESGRSAVNLRLASYRGQPVLTWWEGKLVAGLGSGEFVIADTSYREVARVHAGHGYEGDPHEFVISPQDTALILATNRVTTAPSVPPGQAVAASGAAPGKLIEAVVQEVDIVSGRVLFEWHSLPSVDPSESYMPAPTNGSGWDYLHANSLDIDTDGNLLLCGRHTWSVYKLDRVTGDVLWRLNGKRSDFTMGEGAAFAWQHDARAHADGTLSIFDDGAKGPPPQFETESRGIVLDLDVPTMTARLRQAFVHPDAILSTSQGSFQLLPGGHAFLGWGNVPRFSEVDSAGHLLFDAAFPAGKQSYRAFRYPWTGRPAEDPAVAVTRLGADTVVVYASWNGATDVASWEVLGGATPSDLVSLGRSAWDGFETAIPLETSAAHTVARALDAGGRELGRSPVIAIP